MSLNSNGGGRLPSVTGLPWNCGMERRKAWYGTISAKSFSLPHLDTIPEPKDRPIAGIVETPYGMYKGLVQWDLDENSLDALLDGRTESSGVSVAFKNIASIKSLGNSSLVTLHSGRELYMWGENDVNATNRGIAINLPSVRAGDRGVA